MPRPQPAAVRRRHREGYLRLCGFLALLHIIIPGAFATDVTVRLRWLEKPGKQIAPIHLDLEDYVTGVLSGEAASFRSPASLQAMAVAIRTYAMRYRARHKSEGFDFCDTTHCQDFRSSESAPVTRALQDAVAATTGELLWYEGAPAYTFFSKSCGGQREKVTAVWPDITAAPYLAAAPDPHCQRRGADDWTRTFTLHELSEALHTAGLRTPPIRTFTIARRTTTNRAAQLQINEAAPLAASTFRFAVGRTLGWERVPSDLYTIQQATPEKLTLRGRGSGHGVGLCQRGAAILGEGGANYREILAFYYPGTTLGINAQGLRWHILNGERVELITTQADQDRLHLATIDRLVPALEQDTGLRFHERPRLRLYPTVAAFRDIAGQPGWVAAITRNHVVELQPAATLADHFRPTVRHELAHLLIEGQADNATALPLWFREGIVLALTEPSHPRVSSLPDEATLNRNVRRPIDEATRRLAYRQAQAAVEACLQRYGKAAVLGWVAHGLPPAVTYASISQAVTNNK